MKVDTIEIKLADGVGSLECFGHVPIQLALDMEVQGHPYSFRSTTQWSGVVVMLDGHVLLTRLRVNNGNIIPCDLELSWSSAGMLRLDKPGPFANLNNLLVAEDVGVIDSITVAVLEPESPGEFEVVKDSSLSLVRIFPRVLSLNQGERRLIYVGDNRTPSAVVSGRLSFDPAEEFTGRLDLARVSEPDCTLDKLQQPVSDNRPKPLELEYEWSEPRDADSAVRFEKPPRGPIASEDTVTFKDGQFTLVHGRRQGRGRLITTPKVSDPRYTIEGLGNTLDEYDVMPVTLTMTLNPARGNGRGRKLLFEDKWLESSDQPNGGRLVSSFNLEVKRGSTVLYRSWEDATLEMVLLSPGELLVKSIEKHDAQGNTVKMPFQIRCTISDPSVVEFWNYSDESDAQFVRRTLDEIVAAVGYQGQEQCQISVQLLNLEEPVPIDVDVYRMPAQPATLDVEIPPPLEAHLTQWVDSYFTGARALDLELTPVEEVIYALGTISGNVKNRRGSRGEEITLQLFPDSDPPVDLQPRFHHNNKGRPEDFMSEVDGLVRGNNIIQLSAIKPIQRAMGLDPSIASATLIGVLPRSVALLPQDDQVDGGLVVRRNLGRFKIEYARAVQATLLEVRDSGTAIEVETPDLVEAYDLNNPNEIVNVRLSKWLGNHTLMLIAANDFGDAWAEFLVTAPAPVLEVEFLTDNVPHHPADRSHVGNSVSHVDLRLTAQYCLGYTVSFEGSPFFSPPQPSNPFERSVREITAPEPPRELEVGRNPFELAFGNEFGEDNSNLSVRRRDEVFDVTGRVSIEVYDWRDADIVVVEIRPSGWAGVIEDEPNNGFDTTINQSDLDSPIGFESIRWKVQDDPDSSEMAENFDCRVHFHADSIGPDFERLTSFMEIDPGNVDEEDPDSRIFPIAVLSDQSGLITSERNRYWSQARVLEQSGEVSIALLTRRVF